MRCIYIMSILVLVIITSAFGQKTFEARLIIKNAVNQSDTLYFGIANGATRYIDTAFGEVNILSASVDTAFIDARFSDRFSVHDSNGNYEFENGNVKMGVAPITYESKKQFIDPSEGFLIWYYYYEINIYNTSWPINVSVSETVNNSEQKLSDFTLTSWADPSRWFDVEPLCGNTKYYNINSNSNYIFNYSDLCEFITENGDTVHLLFIGITNNTVSTKELPSDRSSSIRSTPQGFEIPIEIYYRIDDWRLIDAFGKEIQYEYQSTNQSVQIAPTNKTNGFLILTSEKWILEGNRVSKTIMKN